MYDLVEDCDSFSITMEDSIERIMLNLKYSKRNCIFVYDEEDDNSIKFITKLKERCTNRYFFIPSIEVKDIQLSWITDELTDEEKELAKPLIDYSTNLNDSLYSFHCNNVSDVEVNNKIHHILGKKGISSLNQPVYVVFGNNKVKMKEVYYKIRLWYIPITLNNIYISTVSTIR